ncbi:MAG: hypothetical protein ACXAC7_19765 [Candidatus Hodarchaeales archaeon]|jgi:hypothetical protein
MILAYFDTIGMVLALILISWWIFSGFLSGFWLFIFWVVVFPLILIERYLSKYRFYEFKVGKDEQHLVEIHMILERWFGKRYCDVFIDGSRFRTYSSS